MSFITDGVATVLPAPEGYVVDFDNPQRTANVAAYVIAGIGIPLATAFLAQRLYVNALVRRTLDLGDICLVISWCFTTAIQIIIIRAFALKFLGVHAWEMPYTKFEDFILYSVYLNPIVYAPPTGLAKFVLLLFYLQLGNSSKIFKYSVYATIVITLGSNIGIFFSSIFACSPIAMGWDLSITTGTCINRTSLFEATAALAVICDVLIIAIPIPMVVKLKMSRSKKIGLIAMFVVGSITVITSIIRLVLLITALGETDQPWGGGPVSIWILIEGNLLIMCGSLPTLRLFFRTVAPGLLSSSNGGRSKTTSGGLRGTGYGRSGLSGRRGLQTIGSGTGTTHSRKRNEYGRFDEEQEYGMETFVVGGPRDSHPQKKSFHANRSDENDPNNQSREWNEDGLSDKGIVQTKTTQVAYN